MHTLSFKPVHGMGPLSMKINQRMPFPWVHLLMYIIQPPVVVQETRGLKALAAQGFTSKVKSHLLRRRWQFKCRSCIVIHQATEKEGGFLFHLWATHRQALADEITEWKLFIVLAPRYLPKLLFQFLSRPMTLASWSSSLAELSVIQLAARIFCCNFEPLCGLLTWTQQHHVLEMQNTNEENTVTPCVVFYPSCQRLFPFPLVFCHHDSTPEGRLKHQVHFRMVDIEIYSLIQNTLIGITLGVTNDMLLFSFL